MEKKFVIIGLLVSNFLFCKAQEIKKDVPTQPSVQQRREELMRKYGMRDVSQGLKLEEIKVLIKMPNEYLIEKDDDWLQSGFHWPSRFNDSCVS